MVFAHIKLSFYGDTFDLLTKPPSSGQTTTYSLNRRASVKDIIEGLGVPHSEVGAILYNQLHQTFEFIPEGGEHFHIHPLSPTISPLKPTTLRPQPLPDYRFMVDINVSRLGELLRMAGFDALSAPRVTSRELVRTTRDKQRILLSRNRELLKHSAVLHGRLVRSQHPDEQLAEIIGLFQLHHLIHPFSRCMRCNGHLYDAPKEEILDELLPLTKKYYSTFKRCTDCRQIYWRGSHHSHMVKKLMQLVPEPWKKVK